MPDKDIVAEVNKLILEQTNDLWLIASGLLLFEILLVAFVVRSSKTGVQASSLAWFLSASITACALSLGCGYAAKGGLIESMIRYASKGTWTLLEITTWMNLLQLGFVTAALVLFVGAFWWKSKVIANAIVNWSKT
jgi:hypothetical protein